jgi:hypothetical protein
LVRKAEEKRPLARLVVGKVLRSILENGMGMSGLDLYGSECVQLTGYCEHVAGFVKCRQFVDWVTNYSLLKRTVPHGGGGLVS